MYNVAAHLNLGIVLADMGHKEKAVEVIKVSIVFSLV